MSYYINFKYYIYFESTYSYLLQIKIFIDKSIVHITMITYIFKFCELNYLIHVIVLVYKNYLLWIIKTKKYICMIELWKSAFLCEQLKVFCRLPLPPGAFSTLWKNEDRFKKTYFESKPVCCYLNYLLMSLSIHTLVIEPATKFLNHSEILYLGFFSLMFLTVW